MDLFLRAQAKSMNLAGVFVMSETRHRGSSRGLVFLALAIQNRSVHRPSDAHHKRRASHVVTLALAVHCARSR